VQPSPPKKQKNRFQLTLLKKSKCHKSCLLQDLVIRNLEPDHNLQNASQNDQKRSTTLKLRANDLLLKPSNQLCERNQLRYEWKILLDKLIEALLSEEHKSENPENLSLKLNLDDLLNEERENSVSEVNKTRLTRSSRLFAKNIRILEFSLQRLKYSGVKILSDFM